MGFRLVQVDAFADQPFSGNPAAVCILTERASAEWMQNLAKEMNLAETAFLEKYDRPYNEKNEPLYGLRWFTPEIEVALCGHATLASAHVLWEQEYLGPDEEAHFETLSGLLHAKRNADWIELDFPAVPAEEIEHETKELSGKIAEALGVSVTYIGKNRFDYLIEVASEEALKSINPNLSALRALNVRGFIVTASSGSPKFDFVSRFFAPSAGVDEDPVTGSAHSCLGPYWAQKLNKSQMLAFQASRRGGIVRVRVDGDRVFLGGKAVTIFTGEICQAAMPIPAPVI